MKPYAAVITEYNPFHFGHEYQLRQILSDIGGCVCVMSSFAVQRGEFAVCDKYSRAKAAVMCGASLVVENPFPWCSASAADFAAAGVHLAYVTGAKYLAFGIQTDFLLLKEIAALRKSDECPGRVRAYIKNGIRSYPKALEALTADVFGTAAASEMRKPNNILAVEYLINLPDGMTAYPIMRMENFESATQIRAKADMLPSLPDCSRMAMETAATVDRAAENTVLMTLLRQNLGKKSNIYGLEDGLVGLTAKALCSSRSVEEMTAKCQNASYTASRIRRSILHTAFGVTSGNIRSKSAYTVMLAADSRGREILRDGMRIRTVTKPSDGMNMKGIAGRQFRFAVAAENIASAAYCGKDYFPLTAVPYIGK